jgi:hypothetical protein
MFCGFNKKALQRIAAEVRQLFLNYIAKHSKTGQNYGKKSI